MIQTPDAEMLFRHEDAKFAEDVIFYFPHPGIYGVGDGASLFYPRDASPYLYEYAGRKLTGAQIVGAVVCLELSRVNIVEDFSRALARINGVVVKAQLEELGIPSHEHEIEPGLNFAIARIEDVQTEIIYGGDVQCLWVSKEGSVGITPNQCMLNEADMRTLHAKLLAESGGDLNLAWNHSMPVRAQIYRERINTGHERGYALLNGQEGLLDCWGRMSLPTNDIQTMLFFSDGMTRFLGESDDDIKHSVLGFYKGGGLASLADKVRAREREQGRNLATCQYGEKTAVALEF